MTGRRTPQLRLRWMAVWMCLSLCVVGGSAYSRLCVCVCCSPAGGPGCSQAGSNSTFPVADCDDCNKDACYSKLSFCRDFSAEVKSRCVVRDAWWASAVIITTLVVLFTMIAASVAAEVGYDIRKFLVEKRVFDPQVKLPPRETPHAPVGMQIPAEGMSEGQDTSDSPESGVYDPPFRARSVTER